MLELLNYLDDSGFIGMIFLKLSSSIIVKTKRNNQYSYCIHLNKKHLRVTALYVYKELNKFINYA